MKTGTKFILLLSILWGLNLVTFAQGSITTSNQSIESEFRDYIRASITAESELMIAEVEFFYRITGQLATSKNVVEFKPDTTVEATYEINQRTTYFPPGAEIEYWWKIRDIDGNEVTSEHQKFHYLDNRHDFKTLSNDRLTLYWYEGSDAFGEDIFDQANAGLDQLEQSAGIRLKHPVQIFIYANHLDLLNAIAIDAQEWTGGQAFSEIGVILMGIAPSNLTWGLKATTHELTHLVIHQATDNPYSDLPRWLDEGLAVYNEDPDKLDGQYRDSFQEAIDNNNLMTLQTLSSSFPADSEAANQAYGQSGAIVKYIIDTYGSEGMTKLLEIFAEGSLYDDALEEALGVDMRELNNQWLASLGLPPLSDGNQPTNPETDPTNSQPTVTTASETNTDLESPTETETTEDNQEGGMCMTGLIPIFMIGGLFYSRRKGVNFVPKN